MTAKLIVDGARIDGFRTWQDLIDLAAIYKAAGSRVIVIHNWRDLPGMTPLEQVAPACYQTRRHRARLARLTAPRPNKRTQTNETEPNQTD